MVGGVASRGAGTPGAGRGGTLGAGPSVLARLHTGDAGRRERIGAVSEQGFGVVRYRTRDHLPPPLGRLPLPRRAGRPGRWPRPRQPGRGPAHAVVVLGPPRRDQSVGSSMCRSTRAGTVAPTSALQPRSPGRSHGFPASVTWRRLRRDRCAPHPRRVAADPGHRAGLSRGQCQRTLLHAGPDGGERGSPRVPATARRDRRWHPSSPSCSGCTSAR